MKVSATSLTNLQVEIQAHNHTILADEPLDVGGDDLGPNPYDLLLSSLAACKIMTVFMYAERKQWTVDRVTLSIEHKKVKASECEACETEGNTRVDIFTSEIHFEGDLDEKQIARLADISERCPVHRTLTSETIIHTSVV